MGSWLTSHYGKTVSLLPRIALHAIYAQKANLLRKRKEYTSLILMSYMETIWHDLAKLEQEETETHRWSFLKLTISSFVFFLCFYFLAFMDFLASFRWYVCVIALLVYAWLNFNTREDEILYLWAPDWACIIGRVFG